MSAGGPGDSAASLGKKQLRVSSCPPTTAPLPAATHTHTHTPSQGGRQHTCNERDSLGKDAPDAIRAASLPESELFQRAQLHGGVVSVPLVLNFKNVSKLTQGPPKERPSWSSNLNTICFFTHRLSPPSGCPIFPSVQFNFTGGN